jgi:hypothetical protein
MGFELSIGACGDPMGRGTVADWWNGRRKNQSENSTSLKAKQLMRKDACAMDFVFKIQIIYLLWIACITYCVSGCGCYCGAVNPIPRVSFEMLNSPDNVYMVLQPQPNLYNLTIYEAQHLPTTLFTIKYYNLMVVSPGSITTRLVNLLSTVDTNSLPNFCKHLNPQLLNNMVKGANDKTYQAYQNTVNLVLFSRCAIFWGDAPSSHTLSYLTLAVCTALTALSVLLF